MKGVAPLLNLSLNHFKECWHLKIIHFFFAIKVSNLCPLDEFTEAVEAEIRTVRNATRAEGIERIYLPGEIEWLYQQDALRNGIPLHPTHLKSLATLTDELEVKGFWR